MDEPSNPATSGSPRQHRILRDLCRGTILLLTVLVLGGCVSVEFGSDLRQDGSGRHWIEATAPKSQIEQPAFSEGLTTLATIIEQAEEAGFTVERTETDDEIAVTISTEREDSEDVGAALNSLLNATGINSSPDISAPFQGTFRQQSEPVGGTVYVLELVVDGDILSESLGIPGTGGVEAFPAETVQRELDVIYVATLPGEITETNGELLDDNTVRWSLPLSGTATLEATSKISKPEETMLFIVAGGILAALAVVVALIVGFVLVRRRRFTERVRESYSELPPEAVENQEGLWISRKIQGAVTKLWLRAGNSGSPPINSELLDSIEEND